MKTILSIDVDDNETEYSVVLNFPGQKEKDITIIKADSVISAVEGALIYLNHLADLLETKCEVVN